MKLKHKIVNSKATGFTLIEVLVASVILFSSIATVSMIYRGAFISSEKADSHINLSGVLPSILANIRSEIRTQGNSSNTQIQKQSTTWKVSYQWQAELTEYKSAPARYQSESRTLVTPVAKYKLWQVNLTLKHKNLTKQYQFKELSWTDE